MASFRALNSLLLLIFLVVLNHGTLSVDAQDDEGVVTADGPTPLIGEDPDVPTPLIGEDPDVPTPPTPLIGEDPDVPTPPTPPTPPIGGEHTPLQKHVAFFDRDHDGLIYPTETYKGFRALGASKTMSLKAATFIHGLLGPKTSPHKIPSPLLPIYIKNIYKGKHASDTGAYDSEGRFVESKFEDIFLKHAKAHPDALNYDELKEMVKTNRGKSDKKGSLAAMTEWSILYNLFKDNRGLLQKSTVRELYDGTLFYNKAKKLKMLANL